MCNKSAHGYNTPTAVHGSTSTTMTYTPPYPDDESAMYIAYLIDVIPVYNAN